MDVASNRTSNTQTPHEGTPAQDLTQTFGIAALAVRATGRALLGCSVEMQLFPRNPLPAPHRATGLQMITGNYRLTTAHYRQISGIHLALTINVYHYRQFTDKAALFATDYRR